MYNKCRKKKIIFTSIYLKGKIAKTSVFYLYFGLSTFYGLSHLKLRCLFLKRNVNSFYLLFPFLTNHIRKKFVFFRFSFFVSFPPVSPLPNIDVKLMSECLAAEIRLHVTMLWYNNEKPESVVGFNVYSLPWPLSYLDGLLIVGCVFVEQVGDISDGKR